jgi:RNA polymerase sigma-70 factor (ECF subfamily)
LAADMTEPRGAAPAADDDLLEAARGDHRAFARVYAAYRMPVYRYLRTRTTSDDEAADLTALTFERALRALGGYRASGSAVGWLLHIARNAAVDASRRRRPTVSLDSPSVARVGGHDPQPDAAYFAAERLDELRSHVRALPEATRDAIALRYSAGLSAREIAAVLGRSESATQKLISRGLAALREAYREEL